MREARRVKLAAITEPEDEFCLRCRIPDGGCYERKFNGADSLEVGQSFGCLHTQAVLWFTKKEYVTLVSKSCVHKLYKM